MPCDTKENESNNNKKHKTMIIMPVKEGENIERALKKFKRKYERTGVLKELRRRQYFTKPSVAKREALHHATEVEPTSREEEKIPPARKRPPSPREAPLLHARGERQARYLRKSARSGEKMSSTTPASRQCSPWGSSAGT